MFSFAGITRRGISRKVCEELGWRSLRGRDQEVSCRKLFLELERQGEIQLPESRAGYFQANQKRAVEGVREEAAIDVAEVECELSGIGEIRVKPVRSRQSKDSRIWNELMERYHYLGKGPLRGAQVRYLVESSEYGYVGALSYSGSHWRLKAREVDCGKEVNEPLEWMLLTSVRTESFEQACERLNWSR